MGSKKIGIWGWWQGNNLGDNWIRRILKSIFPEAFFIDTSVEDFRKYDFIICGGGGLFIYDVISPWDNYSQKVPFGVIGLGAEFPHDSEKACQLRNKAEFFYVRDQYSLECMHVANAERSYDLTFADPLVFIEENALDLDKVFFVWRDGKELLSNERFNEYIQYTEVEQKWRKIADNSFKTVVADDFQTNEDDIEGRIRECGFVVSGRYHGIVAAIQKGLPFIAIDICPKIRALVKECGLEEYCIKINEADKVPLLIESAKRNYREIRVKERAFCSEAFSTMTRQIENMKFSVRKILNPFKIIHYGSYWMGKNDVVNVMSNDLGRRCLLRKIDLHVYEKRPDKRIKSIEKTPNGLICVLDGKKLKKDIKRFDPDAIILNSGGLTLEDEDFLFLREKGIVSVGISLSDPDIYQYNGKIYADKFDLFYTNSKYSYENQYDKSKVNIGILPFAASSDHHFYMPEVEKKYDVVVVGHAREDRIKVIDKLSGMCKVGTYGNGWKNSLGTVNGLEQTKAINSGKMYLSFSHTVAGYDNVKVGLFEAMACNQVVITGYMEELKDYFEIGREILCYGTEEELLDIVNYYSMHEKEREEIRKAGYKRYLEQHTYVKRWDKVLKEIYGVKRRRERDI